MWSAANLSAVHGGPKRNPTLCYDGSFETGRGRASHWDLIRDIGFLESLCLFQAAIRVELLKCLFEVTILCSREFAIDFVDNSQRDCFERPIVASLGRQRDV